MYLVKNKKYEFNSFIDLDFTKNGDTVLIEYSKEDPSVARVVNKFYMNKYKQLKK